MRREKRMERANKYRIEKVLHEIIRDLPEANTVSREYDRGMITLEYALMDIARIYYTDKQQRGDG